MKDNWLDNEFTFEQLDVPDDFEYENMTDDLGDDPADDDWIKAVAAGEYRHEMPKSSSPKEQGFGLMENVIINVPDEKAMLAGFANIMGWDRTDLTEEGYLKAVVQNKTGKAAVIKDLIGIRSSEDEDS